MLTLIQYKELHPEVSYLVSPWGSARSEDPRVITEGFLQCTAESAYLWSGPFPGNCCRFVLKDYLNSVMSAGPNKGKAMLAVYKEGKEEHFAKIVRGAGNYKPLLPDSFWNNTPSYEKPIALVMYGNDDTSYTKLYATEEEAMAELNLFSETEPLDARDVIFNFGFFFSN